MGQHVWSIIKGQVAVHCSCNNEELCTTVEQAFTIIISQLFWFLSHRIYQCLRVCL